MQEHHVSTPRSARYFTLGSPEHAAEVWFVCHGYGQLASRFLERFRPIEAERRCIVAPEGLSRFYLTESPAERRVGASLVTREERPHEIDDYGRHLHRADREGGARGSRAAAPGSAPGDSHGWPWAAPRSTRRQ